MAFGALVAFTAILLLSPQAWFPILKAFRIAFLAAGIGDRRARRRTDGSQRSITAAVPEIGIALTLVCVGDSDAAALVLARRQRADSDGLLPEGGRVLLAAGDAGTTTDRLRTMAWTLAFCAIPLAATGMINYVSGEFLSTGVAASTASAATWAFSRPIRTIWR